MLSISFCVLLLFQQAHINTNLLSVISKVKREGLIPFLCYCRIRNKRTYEVKHLSNVRIAASTLPTKGRRILACTDHFEVATDQHLYTISLQTFKGEKKNI